MVALFYMHQKCIALHFIDVIKISILISHHDLLFLYQRKKWKRADLITLLWVPKKNHLTRFKVKSWARAWKKFCLFMDCHFCYALKRHYGYKVRTFSCLSDFYASTSRFRQSCQNMHCNKKNHNKNAALVFSLVIFE